MGKHLTSSLRNVIFFSPYLLFYALMYSLSFYPSPLLVFFSHISHLSFLHSLSLICSALYGTIHQFYCFTAFLHLRCFGRKLGTYIPEIFALLIITCDPNQYFSLITLLQYRHITKFLILSILSNSHLLSHIFAMKSNQNIKL